MTLKQENKILREFVSHVISGGDWLADLEKSQDPCFINMPLAYAKDCYRNGKLILKRISHKCS